jgi:hypothetical protein
MNTAPLVSASPEARAPVELARAHTRRRRRQTSLVLILIAVIL